MEYRPTIGLEIHAELKTQTKMFCSCLNDPDESRPNINICPVCMAHPGTLPTINYEAVKQVLRVGTAVNGKIADFTEFDRKSYFYPDIPKGYQISQYAHPLISGGSLAGVDLTRIHLEEDTARSIHLEGSSAVDFNRAGVPLMELVTEPVIHDAETAGNFARELQLLLRTLDAGEANLEKGEMRIEANISVSKEEGKLGTKVEVKNLNSFRSVERAIAFEIKRHIELIESGGEVRQETRGWNEQKQETFHQRFKENSADYRYFPEPDLPKLLLSEVKEFTTENLRASLPELPRERRTRYTDTYGLKENDVEYLCGTKERSEFFDAVARELENKNELVALAVNYIVSDLAGILASKSEEAESKLTPEIFAKMINLVHSGGISSRGAKDLLVLLVESGGEPETVAKANGLIQIHDDAVLSGVVDTVIAAEEKAVFEYKSGKSAALQYLVGKAMKESRGAGNPSQLQKLIIAKLG